MDMEQYIWSERPEPIRTEWHKKPLWNEDFREEPGELSATHLHCEQRMREVITFFRRPNMDPAYRENGKRSGCHSLLCEVCGFRKTDPNAGYGA